MSIFTFRLCLRPWREDDYEPFYLLNKNPQVIEFLPGPMSKQSVEEFMTKANLHLQQYGYTFWAVEDVLSCKLTGFVGLKKVEWESPFTPAVEIGWRLAPEYWGRGYATEAANAAINFGFLECGLDEIVSFTVPENQRSQRVMQRIGMERDIGGDFLHPKLPEKHRLAKHVLYRKNKKHR